MTEWTPAKVKEIKLCGETTKIGNDGYRFYILNKETSKWESCLEYKHDNAVSVAALADIMWNSIGLVFGYTLEEIKKAYWAEFHAVGEVFFDCLGTDEENEKSTNRDWLDFVDALKEQKNS